VIVVEADAHAVHLPQPFNPESYVTVVLAAWMFPVTPERVVLARSPFVGSPVRKCTGIPPPPVTLIARAVHDFFALKIVTTVSGPTVVVVAILCTAAEPVNAPPSALLGCDTQRSAIDTRATSIAASKYRLKLFSLFMLKL